MHRYIDTYIHTYIHSINIQYTYPRYPYILNRSTIPVWSFTMFWAGSHTGPGGESSSSCLDWASESAERVKNGDFRPSSMGISTHLSNSLGFNLQHADLLDKLSFSWVLVLPNFSMMNTLLWRYNQWMEMILYGGIQNHGWLVISWALLHDLLIFHPPTMG